MKNLEKFRKTLNDTINTLMPDAKPEDFQEFIDQMKRNPEGTKAEMKAELYAYIEKLKQGFDSSSLKKKK